MREKEGPASERERDEAGNRGNEKRVRRGRATNSRTHPLPPRLAGWPARPPIVRRSERQATSVWPEHVRAEEAGEPRGIVAGPSTRTRSMRRRLRLCALARHVRVRRVRARSPEATAAAAAITYTQAACRDAATLPRASAPDRDDGEEV